MISKAFGRKGKSKANAIAPMAFAPWAGQHVVDAFAAAIAAQDWTAAQGAYAQMPTWSARSLCVGAVKLDDATFTALSSWIQQTAGQDPLPYLIRGSGGVNWAWEARGSGWSDTVSAEGWTLFFDRLRTADKDLHRAARLDPENPNPWAELLPAAMGLQVPQAERDLRFEQVFGRDRTHLAAHLSYLQCLAAKWSGSDERMWQFAKDVHAGVPAGSPLRVVIATAYIELVASNERAEGPPPHDTGAAVRLVFDAIEKSVLHPNFAEHDPLDQSHSLTELLVMLRWIQHPDVLQVGARIMPLLRNSPNRRSLRYVGGESDEHSWAILCHHFGYDPMAAAA